LPGNGNFIVVKSKFFGRFLMVISAMNVIPRVKMRLSAFTCFEKSCNYTFKTRQSTPQRVFPNGFKPTYRSTQNIPVVVMTRAIKTTPPLHRFIPIGISRSLNQQQRLAQWHTNHARTLRIRRDRT
jgi:hypothetical protein